jgi:hypothetical protein
MVWNGKAWPGLEWIGRARQSWFGGEWNGSVRRGAAVLAWFGSSGGAGSGTEGLGVDRIGVAVTDRIGSFGWARQGWDRNGMARMGWAVSDWLGRARQGAEQIGSQGKVGTGAALSGWFWHGRLGITYQTKRRLKMSTTSKKKAADTVTEHSTEETIKVPPMKITRMKLKVRGISSLITHAWSEKAKKQMRDKQMKAGKSAKEAKNPNADFEAAKYKVNGKDCVPSLAFKNAIVSAARFTDGVKMTVLKGALFVEGDWIAIAFKECRMREDMVKVGGYNGTADLRYRPEYSDWSCVLPIQFNSDVVSAEQIANLVTRAGFSVGICEWRPEKNGQFGRFEVEGTV